MIVENGKAKHKSFSTLFKPMDGLNSVLLEAA
jgi:hypothetical protein